jgi:hypothetical protein
MPTLEDHPLADLFPLMPDDELKSLASDIEANGQREPVWLLDGKLLDGRNRYRASLLIDYDLRVEHYKGKDPLGFVISKNLHRRHLNASQRAMVAAEVAERLSRQLAGKSSGGRPTEAGGEKSREQAADLVGASEQGTRRAQQVKQTGIPELVDAVKSGDVSVSAAAEVAKLPEKEQKATVKGGPKKVKAKAKAERAKRNGKPHADEIITASAEDTAVIIPAAVDGWGIPIQPHATTAFEAVPKFKELAAAIQTAQKLFNEVAGLPGGKFLTLPEVSSYRRGRKQEDGTYADRFVHEGLETAYRQVKAATPTQTVCPYQYAEAKHPKECRTCLGLNWTPALTDSIPKACIEKAKAAFGVTEGE